MELVSIMLMSPTAENSKIPRTKENEAFITLIVRFLFHLLLMVVILKIFWKLPLGNLRILSIFYVNTHW